MLDTLPLPPLADEGLPLVGPLVNFALDLVGTLDKMHARHGKVFRTTFLGQPCVILLGPEAVNLVLQDRELHRMLRSYRFTLPAGYRMPEQLVPIIKPKDGLKVLVEPLGARTSDHV